MLELLKKCKTTMAYMALKSKNYEDCPSCGKKEGAYMSASQWGHNFSCCSDKCGESLSKLIHENISSKNYKNKYSEYVKLRKKIERMESSLSKMSKLSFKSNEEEFSINGIVVRSPKQNFKG